MAKSKAEKPKDQHKSGFMVRLPKEAREMLDELTAESRRPYTTEVLVAIEGAYKALRARKATGPGPAST